MVAVEYYTRDHLGSIREMTDSSGTVQARYDYDPYGRVTPVGTITPASDFQYAGYYAHATSGLNLTLYRAYDPKMARWLSRDPIGEEGGINLYGYVENGPLNQIDELGLAGNGAKYDHNAPRNTPNATADSIIHALAMTPLLIIIIPVIIELGGPAAAALAAKAASKLKKPSDTPCHWPETPSKKGGAKNGLILIILKETMIGSCLETQTAQMQHNKTLI